ncbi:MAG TPA: gamma-glutamyltransferase, partial [Thermomicrobiales bacterium]|nr:gamma-glutamyltransferase [Thermomicrobiales bacterium]
MLKPPEMRLHRRQTPIAVFLALSSFAATHGQATAARAGETGDALTANRGLVVSDSGPASEVGAATLAQGGNAVDAAIATALALAVTLPEAGNLGGGGFMLIYPGIGAEPVCID